MKAPVWLLALTLVGVTRGARADDVACNAAYVETQRLRNAGALRAARTQALRCAQEDCSRSVRADCVRWLEEVERATPSILVEARDASAHDLVGVRVIAGDTLLTAKLDGRPLLVDPGDYVFRFEHQGQVVRQRVLVREGEKYRLVRVQFSTPSPIRPAPSRTTQASKPLPPVSYVLGGATVLGLVAFATLATSGYLSENRLRTGCGRTDSCTSSDVESVRTRYLIADIALGAGILSAAGAVSFWVLAPEAAAPMPGHSQRALTRAPGVTLFGRF